MRSLLLFVALGVTYFSVSQAQAQKAPPDLYTAKMPASPAFSALGTPPADVQRPTTPSGLAVEIVNQFRSDNGNLTVPQGLALEVAPYWLVPHYDLTLDDYGNEGLESVYRNLTVSVATAPSALADTSLENGTDLAIGLRTTVIHPKLSEEQKKCAATISLRLSNAAEAVTREVDQLAREAADREWTSLHGTPPPRRSQVPEKPPVPEPPQPLTVPALPEPPSPDSPTFEDDFARYRLDLEAYRDKLDEYRDYVRRRAEYEAAKEDAEAWDAEAKAFAEHLTEYAQLVIEHAERVRPEVEAHERQQVLDTDLDPCVKLFQSRGNGFSFDLAGALSTRFTDSDFDRGRLQRALGWGTLSYVHNGLTFLALGRYVGDRVASELEHGFDLGGRVVFAQERWGLSGEFINRTIDDPLQRFAALIEYRAFDEAWLSVTVGKNYGDGTDGPLIALANLQFNFGRQRLAEHENLGEP